MNKIKTWLNAAENNIRTQAQYQSLQIIILKTWRQWASWVTNLGDIQVHQRVDRSGNSYWQAYNPLTGRSFCSGSELEIRVWLEQQFYQ